MQDFSTQKNISTAESNTSNEESTDSLFYVEELTEDLIRKFNTFTLAPYFRNVYADLLLRSSPTKDSKTQTVDKVTLVEFINLPGIMSDRFYTLMGNNNKNEQRVVQDKFISTMMLVYSSTLEEKMQLAFNIFDFDCDGRISAEDVKLVLSYIPSRKINSSLSVDDSSNEREKPLPLQEGLYNRSEGKDMCEEERGSNQK
jgi:Ca2+-binding EF-hand superfamily protein